jgi:hypothetical protein
MRKPLFPEDGFLYDIAMMEAEKLYKEWVKSRKGKKGMKVFTIRSSKLEDTDASL